MTLESQPERKGQGRSWQLAAYLVLGLALVGSLPSVLRVYHVFETGVTWEQVPFALHQRALWARNRMCASVPGEQVEIPAEANPADIDRPLSQPRQIAAFTEMAVRLQACWNGDTLIRTVHDDGLGRAVWISGEGFQLTQDGLGRAIAGATRLASPGPLDKTFDVICQEWSDGKVADSRVTRVLALRTDAQEEADFIREDIDILSGQVVAAQRVSRGAGCKGDESE